MEKVKFMVYRYKSKYILQSIPLFEKKNQKHFILLDCFGCAMRIYLDE